MLSPLRQRKSLKEPLPELSKNEKKEERLLPAYEAHHAIVSRYLGIDQFMVKNYLLGLVNLGLFLGGVTLIVLASVDSLHNEHFLQHCCYPQDAPQNGQLGDCRDPEADVHRSSAKQECASFSWIAYVFFGVGAASLVANHVVTGRGKREFDESAVRESQEMLRLVKEGNVREGIRRVSYHPLLFLPESFFLGYHLHTVGHRALAALYTLLVFAGTLSAVLFFFVSWPLDDAWRCYPDPTPLHVTEGRCDDPKADAHHKYSVSSTKHIPVSQFPFDASLRPSCARPAPVLRWLAPVRRPLGAR